MDHGRLILADPQPTEVVKPRQRPLHVPAVFPQPTAVRRPAPGDVRPDATPTQLTAMRLRVETPITIQALRTTTRAARLATHRRDRVDQVDHRVDIGDVGRR